MEDVTILADATLVLIHAEASWGTQGSLLEVLRATCGQRGASVSDQLGIMLGKKVTAFGTYASATPAPHAIGGPASGIVGGTSGAAGTAGVDATVEGGGTFTPIVNEGFNNLNGWIYVPVPEERILVGPGDAVALKLDGTPASLANWYATVTYRELG
jgi:hypothetical protein